MSQKTKAILGVAAFAALLVGAVLAYNALSGRVEPGIDLPTQADQQQAAAPDFTVVDIEGNSYRLSDLRGKPVVLNFWASWCPPCRQEMPEFDRAHRELGGEIMFMMVNLTSRRETEDIASKFVQDNGYGFPVYFDTQGQAANAYHVSGIPATFFIDREGRVVSSQAGALNWAALMRGIEGIR